MKFFENLKILSETFRNSEKAEFKHDELLLLIGNKLKVGEASAKIYIREMKRRKWISEMTNSWTNRLYLVNKTLLSKELNLNKVLPVEQG